jgi:hypothetical protein
LWEAVALELRTFRDLMIFIASDWRRQWNPLVMSSDASPMGW